MIPTEPTPSAEYFAKDLIDRLLASRLEIPPVMSDPLRPPLYCEGWNDCRQKMLAGSTSATEIQSVAHDEQDGTSHQAGTAGSREKVETGEEKKARVLTAFRNTLSLLEHAPDEMRPHFQGAALGLLGALQMFDLLDAAEYEHLAAEIT